MFPIPTLSTTLSASGLLILTAFGAIPAHATEATPTPAEKTAIALEKTEAGSVVETVFTTAVVDAAPTDYLTEIESSVPEVFFFTVIDGMAGQKVIHRWKYQGTVMATAELAVKRDPDKVWSSNKMKPEWTGAWDVEVVDSSGQIIGHGSFTFDTPL